MKITSLDDSGIVKFYHADREKARLNNNGILLAANSSSRGDWAGFYASQEFPTVCGYAINYLNLNTKRILYFIYELHFINTNVQVIDLTDQPEYADGNIPEKVKTSWLKRELEERQIIKVWLEGGLMATLGQHSIKYILKCPLTIEHGEISQTEIIIPWQILADKYIRLIAMSAYNDTMDDYNEKMRRGFPLSL
jgi:hypothetical protein